MVGSKVSKMDGPRVDSSGNLMVWIWVASKVVMMVAEMVFLKDAKTVGSWDSRMVEWLVVLMAEMLAGCLVPWKACLRVVARVLKSVNHWAVY